MNNEARDLDGRKLMCPTCEWLRTANVHPRYAQERRELSCTCPRVRRSNVAPFPPGVDL